MATAGADDHQAHIAPVPRIADVRFYHGESGLHDVGVGEGSTEHPGGLVGARGAHLDAVGGDGDAGEEEPIRSGRDLCGGDSEVGGQQVTREL